MKGRVLIGWPEPSAPHTCWPPDPDPTRGSSMMGSVGAGLRMGRFANGSVDGALWLCDCGRYWHGDGDVWWPISERRARRLIRRYRRRNGGSDEC